MVKNKRKPRKQKDLNQFRTQPKPGVNEHNYCCMCIYTQFLQSVEDVNGNVSGGNMEYVNIFSHTLNRRRMETELKHN